MVASQQFRMRDCCMVDAYISCVSVPIIESSTKIRFGPYQLWFDGLQDLFLKADLSIFNNNWSDIHDFTKPDDGDLVNYSIINLQESNKYQFLSPLQCVYKLLKCESIKCKKFQIFYILKGLENTLPKNFIDVFKDNIAISYELTNSTVPYTYRSLSESALKSLTIPNGSNNRIVKCFLLSWHKHSEVPQNQRSNTESKILEIENEILKILWSDTYSIIKYCKAVYPGHVLYKSREVKYNSEDLNRIYGPIFNRRPLPKQYHSYSELIGSDLNSAISVMDLDPIYKFVSDKLNENEIQQIIDRMDNFADMQMNSG